MRSDYDENLLLAFVEGELSASDRAMVEGWMAADPQLRRLVEGMTADREAMRHVPQPEPPAWMMEEVDRKLERSMLLDSGVAEAGLQGEHQRHVLRRIGWVSSVAALLLVTAGVVLWSIVGLPTGDEGRSGRGTVAMEQPRSPRIEQPVPREEDVAAQPAAPAPAPYVEPLTGLETPLALEERAAPPAAPATVVAKDEAPSEEAAESEIVPASGLRERRADEAVAGVVVEQEQVAQPAQITIHTRDMKRSVEALNQVVTNVAHAELVGGAAVERAGQGKQEYALRVPTDQVANVVMQLQSAADGYQRVELITAEAAAATPATAVEEPMDQRRYESLRRNWPSFAPDYHNILRQQLASESADTDAANEQATIVIPITVEPEPPESTEAPEAPEPPEVSEPTPATPAQ